MRKVLLILVLAIAHGSVVGQDDFDQLIKGGVADANKLLQGYASPLMKAFGYGLSQGWYNTAKTHKKLGVDLTASASLVYIPNDELFYTVNNNNLTTVKLQNTGTAPVAANGSGNVPTIFGPDVEPTYRFVSNGITFKGAGGLDIKKEIGIQALPVPIANLGIGLPKGIDLKLRYLPETKLGKGKISLMGVGIMHDIKQYIPGVKELPFDLSVFAGYTSMKYTVPQKGPDQRIVFEATSITAQGLISKKISILTLYGGIGYNISNVKLGMEGSYDMDDNGSYETKNPVNLKTDVNGARVTGGLRLKLAVFTLHGDYTLQKYNTLTVGIGINVR
jgi:hypothetical protein